MGRRHRAMRSEGTVTLRVLVVDDDDLLRRATVRILTAAGYQVTGMAPEQLGRAFTPVISFDAVLTDYDMPGIDGYQVAEACAFYGVPVIGWTGGETERFPSYCRARIAKGPRAIGEVRAALAGVEAGL